MLGLIRIGAYLLSGFTIWHFFDGSGIDGTSLVQRLALDSAHGMIFGVCAGVSQYTGVDVSLIRFAWALSCLYRGLGIILYILAFIIMPA
ncbi:PspC domain-containing protein|uniref:Phage shock protein C (PspC) family protein n=1 Tax=Dendrosporobacter quercicolus TaxID=146817 RepID=A0A1G9Z8S3_9FIRM|nr:PspC domain-containing protein [Dendrosporobacter quercicolus]NSL48999.1 PspC domain-containing protein [Dendrosporobacter quercicolus DSM 1736]SDN17221.1 phage shock protein C (PspC) family protein [Dendrosporobacter quercicolus]